METIINQTSVREMTLLAAEEKQQLLSRLLARLAHEIRNPLSSLDIHTQLLEEDAAQLEPVMREKLMTRLEVIHGELHRLENIVKHFLRLSGPSELSLEAVDLPAIVNHVCKLLEPEARERGTQIVRQLPAALPPVMADGSQITQALLNLLINALQAVEGNGRVEIRVEQQGQTILIAVADSGPGIPPERITTVFEPYYTTKPEGSGLGLWIVQQIALAHRGDVHAANVPGGGAVIALRLPLLENVAFSEPERTGA